MGYDETWDGPDEEAASLHREDQDALFKALAAVMEDRDLDEDTIVPMLVDALYHYRALAYVAATAKPSEAGLRMDLDRLHKMIEEVHRDYRKNAAEIVRELASFVAALDAEASGETVKPLKVITDGSGR
jgi:uncharacterized membrane-anchored protein